MGKGYQIKEFNNSLALQEDNLCLENMLGTTPGAVPMCWVARADWADCPTLVLASWPAYSRWLRPKSHLLQEYEAKFRLLTPNPSNLSMHLLWINSCLFLKVNAKTQDTEVMTGAKKATCEDCSLVSLVLRDKFHFFAWRDTTHELCERVEMHGVIKIIVINTGQLHMSIAMTKSPHLHCHGLKVWMGGKAAAETKSNPASNQKTATAQWNWENEISLVKSTFKKGFYQAIKNCHMLLYDPATTCLFARKTRFWVKGIRDDSQNQEI